MEEEPRWVLVNTASNNRIEIIKNRMNIGRNASADIICYSDKVSRNHAYISLDEDGDLYVHDNGSINGSFINCKPIESNKLHQLKALDELSFGFHSRSDLQDERKSIFNIIDLKPKIDVSQNRTNGQTTYNNNVLQPYVRLTDIKAEPRTSTPKPHTGYTNEDSVIVVYGSDESDDEAGPCSQLLSERKNNNSQNEPGMGDSIFFEVKQELQDMEEGAEGCVVCIDEDFESSPVSSHDLLAMLEDPVASENNKNSTIENSKVKSDHATANETKVIKEADTSAVAKKYVIPPIIAPHFEVPKSRKRKSAMEVPATKNKRSKSADVTKPSVKSNDDIVKAELREKLKAVAMRTKSILKKEKQTVAPPPAKIKTSASRGDFLTKSLESKPNLVNKKTAPEKPVTVLKPRPTCTSQNLPSTSATVTSEKGKTSEVITIKHGNLKLSKTHEILEDILVQVLSWNPNWFNERNFNETLPPINKKPLLKLLTNFTSYTEYYNIVLPHWIVELWNFLCKEFDLHPDRFKKSFKAQLGQCTNNAKFIELKCFVYISKEESDRSSHIKEEDLVLLDVTFANSEKLRGVYLGCVSNVQKTYIRNNASRLKHDLTLLNGSVPHAVVDFNILMKTSREIRTFKKTIEVIFFTNMVSTWRIFKSIKNLKYSPLCNYILQPNLQNYQQLTRKAYQNAPELERTLNYSQRRAVTEATNLCLGNSPGIYLIQGPPGTGKSTVIVNMVKQILLAQNPEASEQCILLTAPTNTVIDDLVVKLIELKSKVDAQDRKKFKIIRFGPQASIGAAAKAYSLDEFAKANILQTCLLKKYNNSNALIGIQNQIAALKSQLGQNPHVEAALNRNKLLLENKCRELMGKSYNTELKTVEQRLLSGATIICTTLSSCVGSRMLEVFSNSNKISCCIVDESTFSKEQETFIPLTLGISKLVLVGDPKQLPGVTFAKEAKEFGHGNSLFARLMANFSGSPNNPIRLLNVQYRMHPAICSFPNRMYYNGLVKTDSNVTQRNSPICTLLRPYLVLQIENDLKNINQQQEYQNDSETTLILKLVRAIVDILPGSHKINIGIITPYNVQKDSINIILQQNRFGPNVSLSVNTVDSFQGQEKDIIILSSVRIFSNNFLADNQRLNVALTRAKYALYVIGTENLFKTCELFAKLKHDSKNRKLLRCIPPTVEIPDLTKLIKQIK